MKEHVHGVKNMLLSNQELVSPILMALLISNITINIYFITMLLFKSLSPEQEAIITGVIGAQVLFVCFAVQPMIRSAKIVHHLAPILYSAQPLLPSSLLSTKLQVMTYYEMNHSSENEITYTLGPLGKVTNSSLFEVIDTKKVTTLI